MEKIMEAIVQFVAKVKLMIITHCLKFIRIYIRILRPISQQWPSGEELDLDQTWVWGPTQDVGDISKGIRSYMLVPEIKTSQRHPPSPKDLGETKVKSRSEAFFNI